MNLNIMISNTTKPIKAVGRITAHIGNSKNLASFISSPRTENLPCTKYAINQPVKLAVCLNQNRDRKTKNHCLRFKTAVS